MSDVRPVTASDLDAILPLLARFENPRMGREDWRRMLFDLPWPTDEDTRGYALWDGPRAVGFLGAIPSRRAVGGRERRFVNLSSWIVEDAHRSESFKLVLAALADRARTIVNLSPSPAASEIFSRLGFLPLETGQVLVPLLSTPLDLMPAPGVRVLSQPDSVRDALDDAGQRRFDDLAGTRAAQLALIVRGKASHVVATLSPWKGAAMLSHVQYADDWNLVLRHASRVARGFRGRIGTWGLRIDARHAPGRLPAFSVRRALPRPHLYRPEDASIPPALVDGLYTEAVGLAWSEATSAG
ncbi:MAG: hypothetical protein ABI960_05765 [Candidatus Eisenbacteria bacterium]